MASGVQHDKPDYIPTLDGWRAISIALVVGAHSVVMLRNGGSAPGRVAASLFSHAGYGVDIFFVISGFLITTLLLQEKERSGTLSMSGFYLRRFFRIIPPILAYLAVVMLLVALSKIEIGRGEIAASLFFYHNYYPGSSWYTSHFWSLSIEEQFYAVMPLLILFTGRRALLIACLLLIAGCIVIRWYEFSIMVGEMPRLRTEARVDGLLWGAVWAQMFRDQGLRERIRRGLRGWVVAAVLIVTVALLFAIEDQAFRRTLVALTVPIFLAFTILNAAGLAGRLLEHPAMRFVGRRSYSLYIWQMMFLLPGARDLPLAQSFPLALILPFVSAMLSYAYTEKPFIRIGHILSARVGRRAREKAAVAA